MGWEKAIILRLEVSLIVSVIIDLLRNLKKKLLCFQRVYFFLS